MVGRGDDLLSPNARPHSIIAPTTKNMCQERLTSYELFCIPHLYAENSVRKPPNVGVQPTLLAQP